MGAVLELTLYYKDIIPLSEIIEKIDAVGYRVIVNDLEIVDDWLFTNHQVLKYAENAINVNEIIFSNKIILTNFTVNGLNCGYHILKVDEDIYEICIWLNTEGLSFLDDDVVTDKSKFFYDRIVDELISNIDSQKLILIGIGVETMMEYDRKLENIVANSKNVLMWIFPKDKKLDLQSYSKREKEDFLICYLEKK